MLSLAWLRDGPSMATRRAVEHHGSGHDVFDDDNWPLAVRTDYSRLGNVSTQCGALFGGHA